jgi:hypothetical protein
MAEFIFQPSDMLFLHAKDQIGPADMAAGYFDSGTNFCSCGSYIVVVAALKDFFGCEAAPFIFAADEK